MHEAPLYNSQVMVIKEMGSYFMILPIVYKDGPVEASGRFCS
jgi:hypothetical protein